MTCADDLYLSMKTNDLHFQNINGRRQFVSNISKLAGAAVLLSSPITGFAAAKTWTVGEIMDLFIKAVKGAPFGETVDTLKSGSRDTPVTGIVTGMFATIPLIKQAISVGANFIIAHEPTFYNHLDKTDWLKNDAVYQYKFKLLNDHKIAVWRNHDYIHSHEPDGVYDGVLQQLGWNQYAMDGSPWNIQIPPVTLGELINLLKKKLNIKQVRYIGDQNQICKKVFLSPGASGGERHITAIGKLHPDVAIVGELHEWETAEYIRDARASGQNVSLVVLGHTDSEDAGSVYMKEWLTKNVPDIKVTHIHSGNPLSFA